MLTTNRGIFSLDSSYQKLISGDWPVPDTIIRMLDDISPQFDGDKSAFDLTVDTASISSVINNSIVDSKDLDVAINGLVLQPYVTRLTWPFIVPYETYRGFRVSGDKIIFYSPPPAGSQCSITLRNVSTTIQTRRYPYTASSIALGD